MAETLAATASRVVSRHDDPLRPPGRHRVILEDDSPIVWEDDDARAWRG
jgi:hypothetical protein